MSVALRVSPVKKSRKPSLIPAIVSAEIRRGSTVTVSSSWKVYAQMPPWAATYWSCLPEGSPRTSISMWHAASAIVPGVLAMRPARLSAFIRQTVNEPDDPSPVPAGMSATDAISSGLPSQWRRSVSRKIGWRISLGSSTSSNSEYFSRKRFWKTVWVSM